MKKTAHRGPEQDPVNKNCSLERGGDEFLLNKNEKKMHIVSRFIWAVFDDGVMPRTPMRAVFDDGVLLRTPS